MEGLDVELRAKFLFGFCPQLHDADFTKFVRQRLRRPRDVAVNFGRHFVFAERGVVAQVGQRLVASPAHVMHTGVDHQSAGAPHFVGEPAEIFIRRFVDAHLGAELLGVQRPAFAIRRDVILATKRRLVALFAGKTTLQRMAGRGLVQRQRRQVVERP